MNILAHRGYWKKQEEKNLLPAFERAFQAGYGAELDVRDLDGTLVVSHDPPRRGCLEFATLLEVYRRFGMPGKLAVNIKSDGLAPQIASMMEDIARCNACFVFDMSVPDMVSYLRHQIPVFTRYSEYEQQPSLLERCEGVWVDSFTKPWADPTRIAEYLVSGKHVAIVSPELHGKPNVEAWRVWREAVRNISPASRNANLMICTDRPLEAEQFFSKETVT